MTPYIPKPPPDWPSPHRIHTFFCLASAVESRTETSRRIRQLEELPQDVRITEASLLKTLSWESYWQLTVMYSERLTKGARTGRLDADT